MPVPAKFSTKTKSSLLIIAGLLILVASATFSQEVTEYRVKAAFIDKFARFVQWPDSAFHDQKQPIVLGILGEDPFGREIDALEGRTVGNRKIKIERFKTVDEIETCHILFISASENSRLAAILTALKNRSILTIGDLDSFTDSGGIINLRIVDESIRFEINPNAAKRAGLRISSQLLRLAANLKLDKGA